jgi:TrkA domain protein
VEQIKLPGIGVRHDLITSSGWRLGVISHRDGQRDLVVFDPEDPDAARDSVPLTNDEAAVLADVLGASLMLGQLAGLREQAEGLLTEQISLTADSPYVGRPLGDSRARTRTGVSIVAVLRHGAVVASPTPDFRFVAGDVVVAVGTRPGLEAVSRILAEG